MPPKGKKDPVRGRTGRPPRIQPTHEVVAQIVDLIEKGTNPLSASRAVGIPRRTWYQWLAAGESDGADPRLMHLSHSVRTAKGRLASRYFATLNTAALGHDRVVRDSKGNVVFTVDEKGRSVPFMEHVPGSWPAAVRALESLSPDEMLRPSGGSPVGGGGDDPDGSDAISFDIVYLTSNRDPKEMAEINRRIEERARRVSTES